jgi:hypothetical protein
MNQKYRKPLVKDKQDIYPDNHKCPICNKQFNDDFVTFNAGALINNKIPNPNIKIGAFGLFSLHYDSKNKHNSVNFAEDVKLGQYEIYTCSIKCMKKLFNNIIDSLK